MAIPFCLGFCIGRDTASTKNAECVMATLIDTPGTPGCGCGCGCGVWLFLRIFLVMAVMRFDLWLGLPKSKHTHTYMRTHTHTHTHTHGALVRTCARVVTPPPAPSGDRPTHAQHTQHTQHTRERACVSKRQLWAEPVRWRQGVESRLHSRGSWPMVHGSRSPTVRRRRRHALVPGDLGRQIH